MFIVYSHMLNLPMMSVITNVNVLNVWTF